MLGVANTFVAAEMAMTIPGGMFVGAHHAQALEGNLASLGIRSHNPISARPVMCNGRRTNPTPKF